MNVLVDIFGTAVEFMVEQACKDIDNGNWDKALKAYNRYQADERDCADYIYNTGNADDMVSLLKSRNFTFAEIANATNDEYPFIVVEYNSMSGKYNLRGIDGREMMNTIKGSLHNVMECVIEYAPYCEDYLEVYKEYVSNRIEPSDKC